MAVIARHQAGGGVTCFDLSLPGVTHPASARLSLYRRAKPDTELEILAFVPHCDDPDIWHAFVRLDGPHDEDVTVVAGGAVRLAPAEASTLTLANPAVDYTARDFGDQVDLLQELLGITADQATAPATPDAATPVAQTSALVDLFAYVGDSLSYQQDGLATEAHLLTARRRISVTRHAATLGYRADEGANARTWIRLTTDGDRSIIVPKGTQVATTSTDALRFGVGHDEQARVVFETMGDVTVHPEPAGVVQQVENAVPLDVGSTDATIGSASAVRPGDLVLLEALGERAHPCNQVVRIVDVQRPLDHVTSIRWHRDDALQQHGADWPEFFVVRVGNLVLADEGSSDPRWLELPDPGARRYWPKIDRPDLVFAGPTPAAGSPAAEALLPCRHGQSRPALELRQTHPGSGVRWWPVPSLLAAGPFSRSFVVEVESDGTVRLRFGDGVNGQQPQIGEAFALRCRRGVGADGNVAAAALCSTLSIDGAKIEAHNPVPATGGRAPESEASIRVAAPSARFENDRAVRAEDQRDLAREVPGVIDADVRVRSGLGGTVFEVNVLPEPGAEEVVRRSVIRHLEPRQMMGSILAVTVARHRRLALAVDVAIAPSSDRGRVIAAINSVFQRRLGANGHFGLGTSVHRSELIAGALGVDGVVDAEIRRFGFADGLDVTEPGIVPDFGVVLSVDRAEPVTVGVIDRW